MSWIGFDLDGTLAHHDKWKGPTHIGDPIIPMIDLCRDLISQGKDVRIFTARIYPLMYVPYSYQSHVGLAELSYEMMSAHLAADAIRAFSLAHFGRYLAITCVKDYEMWQLYDDRAIQVISNTGVTVEEQCKLTLRDLELQVSSLSAKLQERTKSNLASPSLEPVDKSLIECPPNVDLIVGTSLDTLVQISTQRIAEHSWSDPGLAP